MKIIMKIKYVTKRRGSDNYYFKFNIPADCREELGGKSEIQTSLKTTDPEEAKVEAERLARMWKEKIASVRQQVVAGSGGFYSHPKKLEDIDGHAREVIAPHVERIINKNLGKSKSEIRRIVFSNLADEIEKYEACIHRGAYTDAELMDLYQPFSNQPEEAWEMCFRYDPKVTPDKNMLAPVARRLLPVLLEGFVSVRTAMEAELQPHGAIGTIPSVTIGSGVKPGYIISEVLDEMLRVKKKRSVRTVAYLKANVQLLIDWIGDVPVVTLDKPKMLDFRDNCLCMMPKHINKKPEYDGLSLKQVVERFGGTSPTSNRTVNNKLTSVIQLINYAMDNRYLEHVSTRDIKLPEDDGEVERAFAFDELKIMLGLLEIDEKRPSRYWVPLIGMYTGARLNEICQLHTDDIYEVDGIWIIDINENNQAETNKHLKGKDSKRVVPIHPKLIDSGLIDFVQTRSRESKQPIRLFQDLSFREGHGYRSRAGHWFNKTFRPTFQIGKDGKKNFHSLRYSFIQQCQNQDDPLDDRAIMELTGHALTTAGMSAVHLGYSGNLKPKALYAQIIKLDYGFDKDRGK